MTYSIEDPETVEIIRRLAKAKGKPILDAIREACLNELERERSKAPLWNRLQPMIGRVAAHPLRADQTHRNHKEFLDDMWADKD
jgi:antitoxin VapB